MERFIARLERSKASKRLILKGALLFDLWFKEPHRPTRDADFLGIGKEDAGDLEKIVREVCAVELDDGIRFDAGRIVLEPIRENASYGGIRARFAGTLDTSKCHVQLDVGYGDVITGEPLEIAYPSILDGFPPVRVLSYPRETAFAEKLEAIVSLGMTNSRMKDFYDLRALVREGRLDRDVTNRAIAATFARRKTAWSPGAAGLSEEFGADKSRQALWTAFLRRNRLDGGSLAEAIEEIRGFVLSDNGK